MTPLSIFRRRASAFAVVSLILSAVAASAGPRSSADYSINADAIGIAGSRTSSPTYTNDSNAGGITGISSGLTDTAKHGYVGQLYDIVALSVTAPPSDSLNENTSRQLDAAPLADDATTLPALDPAIVSWSIVSGPIASISNTGLATTAFVYQDSPASINANAQGLTGQLNLTVLNVTNDDFGTYANDGINDAWQVQYFGENNPQAAPNADPDGDGQSNLFEYIAGTVPNSSTSRFQFRTDGRGVLVFSALVSGRTYTVQYRSGLTTGSTDWAPLTSYTQTDNGAERTVIDTDSSSTTKFYRVSISMP